MRKNIILCVLFIGLIVMGECSKMQMPQGTLTGKNGAHILKKSNLGRALVQMIEMYTKNSSGERDFSKLFQTLDLLKQSLLAKESDENQSFKDDGVTHVENLKRISEQITSLNEQIITLDAELTTLNELKVELQTDLLNLQTELTATETQWKTEQELLKQLQEDFEREDTEFSQALNILEEAISYLNEAYLQHESAFTSFAQKHSNRFEEISILLESNMKKIARSKFLFVEVLKNIFLEMKQGVELDADSIDQAINALNDLHSYLTLGKTQLEKDFETQTNLKESIIAQLFQTVGLLRDEQIPVTEKYVSNNQDQIDIKTDSLNEAKDNLEQEQENLRLENESWEKRVEYNELLVNQLQSEFATVEQAENILQAYNSQ